MNQTLLKLRKEMKRRKPRFIRQDYNKKGKIPVNWRESRGMDSKMRQKLRGYRRSPSKGYQTPAEVRGLHPSGYREVIVSTIATMESMDKAVEGMVISRTVGNKRRIELIKKAQEKGIKILNIKNPEQFVKEAEEAFKKKVEAKKKKIDNRNRKEKEQKEGKKEKKDLTEKLSDEEKKEEEKKEKDKVLIKQEK
jgi:large subunit ribosomal protein L32e